VTTAAVPLPGFLVIGAQKSATRWLRSNLGQHPDAYAPAYELSFFNSRDRYERLGLEWYRRQFREWDGQRVTGEATPGYLMWGEDPALTVGRIADTVPEVRLVALLRNPVDRAQSALVHHQKRERIRPSVRLVEFVQTRPPSEDPLGVVSGGWYAASLRPYVERFGEQLLVLLYDDVRARPHEVYRAARRHVGLSDDFVPPDLERVVASNRDPADGGNSAGLTDEERAVMWTYFADDCRELEGLLGGVDVSSWDPTRSGPTDVGPSPGRPTA
jgi:hypothetical protein